MKIIRPSFEIMNKDVWLSTDAVYTRLESAGRLAYKSESKTTEDSAEGFVRSLVKRGHESVIEHVSVSVKVVCDRGVSHEIVRHRLASYTQESTRYCNYGKHEHVVFIKPCFLPNIPEGEMNMRDVLKWLDLQSTESSPTMLWMDAMAQAEAAYQFMLKDGCTPQEARSVLPNSLKTEILMTANLREWRHFFKMRCAAGAHPQMREIAVPMLAEFQKWLPAIFYGVEV